MPHRQERVSHEILREVNSLIASEAQDPGLAHVTATRVEVTGDLRHAVVYYTTRAPEAQAEMQAALERAAGFIRRALARGLDLRFAPDLKFAPDDRLDKENEIDRLLDSLHERKEE